MNREGILSGDVAHSAARESTAISQEARQRRDAMLMLVLWLFIGIVAAYDVYLSVKFQDTLRFEERNPLGQWLLQFDGGSIAVFMGCKFLGTTLVLGILQLLYIHWRRIGLTVTSVMAGLQGVLMLYLAFG